MQNWEREIKKIFLKSRKWAWRARKTAEKIWQSQEVKALRKSTKKLALQAFDKLKEQKIWKTAALGAAVSVLPGTMKAQAEAPVKDAVKINVALDNEQVESMEHESLTMAVLLCSEGCRLGAYSCGVRTTVGVGTTIDMNGRRIKKGFKIETERQAYELSLNYRKRFVNPYISDFVERKMNSLQTAAVISKIYNVGTGPLFGYNERMLKIGKPSRWTVNWNAGKSVEECADYLMGFTMAGGKRAWGLVNRSYLEGALFRGLIKPHELLEFKLEGIYAIDGRRLIKKEKSADGSLVPDYSPEVLAKFKQACREAKGEKVGAVLQKMGLDVRSMAYQISLEEIQQKPAKPVFKYEPVAKVVKVAKLAKISKQR